jgi:hypothetical protein
MPKNALMATVFGIFKWDYLRICMLTFTSSTMKLLGPFLIHPLVTFIRDGKIPEHFKGITFVDNRGWLAFLTPDK